MKTLSRLPLALGLLLAGAAAAAAGDVRSLNSGDTVTGTAEEGVLEVVPIDLTEKSLLDVDLRMAAGSGAHFDIQQPDRSILPGLDAFVKKDSKGARAQGKKIPVDQSGRHFLRIRPVVAGAYTLKVKVKAPKKATLSGFIVPAPPTPFLFGGSPGAVASVKLAAGKGSDLAPKIVYFKTPSGVELSLSGAVHKASAKFDQYTGIVLDELGTYEVGLGSQSGLYGNTGVFTLTLKYPRLKPTKRTDADLVVDPAVDAVDPAEGFDNLSYASVAVTGMFFTPGAEVRLEGEGGTIPASSTVRYNDGVLGFDVDLDGRATGDYDVVVSLSSGGEGRLPGGFTVLPTPVPSGISPALGFDNRSQAFTITGTRFEAGLAVAVRPAAGGTGVSGIVGSVTDTTIAVIVPLLNAPLGSHDVVVTNVDGGTRTLAGALTVATGPRIAAAAPLLGHDNDDSLRVDLSGAGYAEGMAVTLEKDPETPIAAVVGALTSSTCEAEFDLRGRPSGAWILRATNPDGGTITFGSSFNLVRAPRLTALAPDRGFQGDAIVGAVATGTDLVSGAEATLVQGISTTVTATSEAVGGGGTTLTMDLDVSAAPVGEHDLSVVNPDAGAEILPAALTVLGRRPLASGVTAAGPVAAAYNADDDEYMVVYSVTTSGQKDIRARRWSGATGAPVGSEIEVTSLSDDASSTENQTDPAVVYAPSKDLWLVVYAWNDAAASGDTVKVKGQFLNRDGTLNTTQANALPLFSQGAGTVSRPRIAWNATRENWMVVWAWDASGAPDVYHVVYQESFVTGEGTFIPGEVSSGVLVSTTHQVTVDGNPVDLQDRDGEPDVAWSSARDEYLVCYGFDVVEGGSNPPPPDTGWDVRAKIYSGDFGSGPNLLATLTNLGDVSNKDERRPRAACDPASNRYMVAWEYAGTAGNRDLRAFLVNAVTRTRVGTTPTTLDQTSSEDVAEIEVVFDPTAGTGGWIAAHTALPGVSGSTRIAAARIPVSAGAPSGLGTPAWRTVAAAAAGATWSLPCVAVRGSGAEFLAGWGAAGTGLDPAEIRFWR